MTLLILRCCCRRSGFLAGFLLAGRSGLLFQSLLFGFDTDDETLLLGFDTADDPIIMWLIGLVDRTHTLPFFEVV